LINVFDIGISISLIDKASAGIGALARSAVAGEVAVAGLQTKLTGIQNSLFKGGMMLAGAGALAAPIVGAIHSANEYQHQINKMNTAGLSHKEMVESIAAAWKTTGTVITSTATENLKTIMDLRSVFGKTAEGIDYLPTFAKMQGAFISVSDGKFAKQAENLSFSAAKALDMIGAVRNRKEFDENLNMMFRATVATGGRVTPQDYMTTFKYARQAKFGFNQDFLYKLLPELILENKGGGSGSSGGAGPQLAALYRFGIQGIMKKQAAEMLVSMGMIHGAAIQKTSTTGTTVKAPVLGADLLRANPFDWVQKIFVPHLASKFKINPTDTDKLVEASNQVFKGNQLATSLVGELIKKKQQYMRFPGLFDKTEGIEPAFQRGLRNDPDTNFKALGASWENLKIALGKNVVPIMIPIINELANTFNSAGRFFVAHPGMAKAVIGLAGVGVGLLTLGGIAYLTKAALGGLGLVASLVTGPLGKIGTAFLGLSGVIGQGGLLMSVGGLVARFIGLGIGIGAVVYAVQHWNDINKWAKEHMGQLKIGLAALVWTGDRVNAMIGAMIGKFGDLLNTIGGLVGWAMPGLEKKWEQDSDNYLKSKGISISNNEPVSRGTVLNGSVTALAHEASKRRTSNVVPIWSRMANQHSSYSPVVHQTFHLKVEHTAPHMDEKKLADHITHKLGDQMRSALKHTTAGQGVHSSRFSQGRDPL
jgi:hypothetical protein